MRAKVPAALTVAGSDSGGGAGIEADIKTFAALGVHGLVAITAVTAQNTFSIKSTYVMPAEAVRAQIEAVAEDFEVSAVKTGMLCNAEIVRVVADAVRRHGFPLVIDPVLKSKSGATLLSEDGVNALIKELIPLAKVVTPNAPEAGRLTGLKVGSVEEAKEAARVLVEELGAEAAVIKGGHLSGPEAVDVLYHRGRFKEFKAPRIEGGCTHGTGCVFSAAMAACLAKGLSIEDSVKVAKEVVTTAIRYGTRVGRGHCPVNPSAWVDIPAERWRAVAAVAKAVEILEERGELVNPLVPEVQMNVVTAIPARYARGVHDVAAVKGRVVRYGKGVRAVGPPEFGASSHLARAVLKAMEFDPSVRGAVNVRFSEEFIKAAQALGLTCSYYDRSEEPEEVKAREGATIPWGVETAVKRAGGRVPDIVFHRGDVGKEPMINVFGLDAVDAVRKLIRVAEAMRRGR